MAMETPSLGSDTGTRTVDAFPPPYPGPSLVVGSRRALGSGEDGTITTTTSNGIPITQTLFPSSSSSSGSDQRQGISQTVLEWVFAVIALGLLAILVIWRYSCMKYRSRTPPHVLPSSRGRRPRLPLYSRPRPQSQPLRRPSLVHVHNRDSSITLSGEHPGPSLVLSPTFLHTGLMPLVDGRGVQINGASEGRTRGRRVRGLDVDEGGRRGGGGGDLEEGPGDELPAYEVGKAPPGYHAIAIGSATRPDIVEIGLPERTLVAAGQDMDARRSTESPRGGREAHNAAHTVRPPASRDPEDETGSSHTISRS